jgi:opacity protein-like surface antigen
MRKIITLAALAIALSPTAAFAQRRNEVEGFGGVTFGTSNFGSAASSTFGGRVAVGLTDNLQAIGEAGRLADIESPLYDLLDFRGIGARVSAYYGEGGIRFIASPRSVIRPYGEATAGFARLNAGLYGLGPADAFIDTGLALLNRTEPLLGVGGGVLVQSGPVSVDLGYRYKKISAPSAIASLGNLGNSAFEVNQIRLGVGVRF